MRKIHSYQEWLSVADEYPQVLLFVKTDHCSVCDGLYPQVAALQELYSFPFVQVNAAEVPELAGQLGLFTAPVVLLYNHAKEYARFARIVPMNQLRIRMDELAELES